MNLTAKIKVLFFSSLLLIPGIAGAARISGGGSTSGGGGGGGSGTSILVQEEGSNVVTTSTVNFVGAGVTATSVSGVGTVTVPGETIQDEGFPITQRSILNFIGSGVNCIDNSGNASSDCTISGTSPAGSDTQVQFNNGGSSFGASANFTWDGSKVLIQGDNELLRFYDTDFNTGENMLIAFQGGYTVPFVGTQGYIQVAGIQAMARGVNGFSGAPFGDLFLYDSHIDGPAPRQIMRLFTDSNLVGTSVDNVQIGSASTISGSPVDVKFILQGSTTSAAFRLLNATDQVEYQATKNLKIKIGANPSSNVCLEDGTNCPASGGGGDAFLGNEQTFTKRNVFTSTSGVKIVPTSGTGSTAGVSGALLVDGTNAHDGIVTQVYRNDANTQGQASALMALINDATSYNTNMLWIISQSTSTLGGNADINVHSNNPDWEMRELDQYHAGSGIGQWELALNNDNFQINFRNTGDTSFQNMITFDRNQGVKWKELDDGGDFVSWKATQTLAGVSYTYVQPSNTPNLGDVLSVFSQTGTDYNTRWITPSSGGGASSLAVGTGTGTNFTNNVTSPTAAISFNGAQFTSIANGTTNFIGLSSSETFTGRLTAKYIEGTSSMTVQGFTEFRSTLTTLGNNNGGTVYLYFRANGGFSYLQSSADSATFFNNFTAQNLLASNNLLTVAGDTLIGGTISNAAGDGPPVIYGGFVGNVASDFESIQVFDTGGGSGPTVYVDFVPGAGEFNGPIWGNGAADTGTWQFNAAGGLPGFDWGSVGGSGNNGIAFRDDTVLVMNGRTTGQFMYLNGDHELVPGAINLDSASQVTGTVQVANGGVGMNYSWNASVANIVNSSAPYISNSTGAASASVFFDEISTQAVTYSTMLNNYQNGTLKADIVFASTATSGTVNWGVYIECKTPSVDGLNYDTDSYSTVNSTSVTLGATSGMAMKATATLTNGDSCANGDTVRIKLERRAGLLDTAAAFAKQFFLRLYE